jgi:hypothetical protein
MSLLERIAYSNGNSQRTIAALRLVNDLLKQKMTQQSATQTAGAATASKQDKSKRRQTTAQLPMVLVA